jgi:hypothetical protein
LSQLQEWWFPFQVLSILKHSQATRSSLHQFTKTIFDTSSKLAGHYACSIVLKILLNESDLSQTENLTSLLESCALKCLSSTDILQSQRLMLRDTLNDLDFIDPQHPASLMNRLKEKLQNYIKSTQNSEQVNICFFKLIMFRF